MRQTHPWRCGLGFYAVWFMFIWLFQFVLSAPQSSSKKRLAEYEAGAQSVGSEESDLVGRGCRQRVEQVEQASSSSNVDRPLVNSLRRDWASGEISASALCYLEPCRLIFISLTTLTTCSTICSVLIYSIFMASSCFCLCFTTLLGAPLFRLASSFSRLKYCFATSTSCLITLF